MQIFHIATAADWAAAQRAGAYSTSTRGVSLEQEGFIHAARREQVQPVWKRYYADAGEPLVLLTIDTDKLTSRWQEDPVGEDSVWVHNDEDFLIELDRGTGARVRQITADVISGGDMTMLDGELWVAAYDDQILFRIDPS